MSKIEYVAGFLFDDQGRVVLVRKNKPRWMSGLLNAVGGKIEPGEDADEAMRREFDEETGVLLENWEYRLTLVARDWQVYFYRKFVTADVLQEVRTMESEPIEVWNVGDRQLYREGLPNLTWLLPSCYYRGDDYYPYVVCTRDEER